MFLLNCLLLLWISRQDGSQHGLSVAVASALGPKNGIDLSQSRLRIVPLDGVQLGHELGNVFLAMFGLVWLSVDIGLVLSGSWNVVVLGSLVWLVMHCRL